MGLSPASSRESGGVTSVAAEGEAALTGAVTFSPGTGVTLTQAAQDIEIAASGTSYWDAIVRKAADESVASSTVLQDDNELFIVIADTTPVYFELIVLYGAAAAADMKHAFATSAGSFHATCWRQYMGLGPTTGVVQASQVADMTTAVVQAGGVDPTSLIRVIGNVRVSQAATVTFQWAQNTSDLTATVVKAGSTLSYRVMD